MSDVIRVNFSKPMPLFPLPDVVLLPHAIQPLHIFEPRYRRMIEHTLDGAGQIAMASFACDDWKLHYQHGLPKLRPAVCVGQIAHHESLEDGRHNILLHGVCRAQIVQMIEPEGERPYRMAMLSPLEPDDEDQAALTSIRQELKQMLISPRLSRMRSVETVMEWFNRSDVTTHALLELIGFALVRDSELKYQLLAEACPKRRAGLIKHELATIDHLVEQAERQAFRSWPKGMSWN
jgi:Lon protease-like protein